MSRPNILWYCTDQQRYDTIHCLGNPLIRTPNLDRLVAQGVAFTSAYTQCPICTPSRATFLTGRYPASHHVHRNGNDSFPSHETLVTRILADAGYDCGLAGKLHLSRAYGRVEKRVDDGYRVFHWSHHPMPDWPHGHAYAHWLRDEKNVDPDALWSPLRGRVYGAGVPEEYHQTTWCTEMAIRFITEKRDGPWLMSINPFDPHPPFDPPAEYLAGYDPEQLSYPLFRENDVPRQKKLEAIQQQTRVAINPYLSPEEATSALDPSVDTASVPPAHYDARMVKACYYAMIELIDHQFGRIVEVLEQTGQLENTLIIFSSDHGELLGDHGLIYKGCRFFEALVHVPLVISFKGRFRQGLRSQALVELVDLAPTLLEVAGLPIPDSMQGRSLLPMLTGAASPTYHKDHVVCEYHDAIDLPGGTHATMYFDGRYKSILYHGEEVGELYDLEADPGEFNDLWDDADYASLKASLLIKHFDAIMATSSAGINRSGSY
jgi:arylsulfatase